MSRDAGVYILITKGLQAGTLEYRVTYAQAIEVLWEHDAYSITELINSYDKPVPNKRRMLDVFGKNTVTVHNDLSQAFLAANELYGKHGGHGQVEYGICPIDCSDIFFPGLMPTVL